MKASELIEAYDALIEKALGIIEGTGCYADHTHLAGLSIEGATATLSWPEADSGYYNSCSVETQKTSFPAHLLEAPDEEIAYWKAEQKRLAEIARQRWAEERKESERQRELNMLAALQAKYGNAQ